MKFRYLLILLIIQIPFILSYIDRTIWLMPEWRTRLEQNQFIGDEPSYLHFDFSSPSTILNHIRAPGLPIFIKIYNHFFHTYQYWPQFQFFLFVASVLFLFWAMDRFGFDRILSFVFITALLWNISVYQNLRDIYSEILTICFFNLTIGSMFLTVKYNTWRTNILFAGTLFYLYQVRSNLSYVVALAPLWAVLCAFLVREIKQNKIRLFVRIGLLGFIPLFLFGFVRFLVLGHFGFSTMAGGTLAGHATDYLNEINILKLDGESRTIAEKILETKRKIQYPCNSSPFQKEKFPNYSLTDLESSCFASDLITAWEVVIKYETGKEPSDNPDYNLLPWIYIPDVLADFHTEHYHVGTDTLLMKYSVDILKIEWSKYISWLWNGWWYGLQIFYTDTATNIMYCVLVVLGVVVQRIYRKKVVWKYQIGVISCIALTHFVVGYGLMLMFNYPFFRQFAPFTPYIFPSLLLWAIPPFWIKK